MIAYFTASIVGKKYHLQKYLAIINYLKSKQIQVLSDHIIKTTEDQIRISKKNDRIKFHKNLTAWIHSCDFMVVEASFPSISVGYEISIALQSNKPVLVLYSQGDPPSLLTDVHEERVVCEKYTLDTLSDTINDFLLYVKGASDLRFTFFISPQISFFLDKLSKKKDMPKSVYLRRLIEKDMAKRGY